MSCCKITRIHELERSKRDRKHQQEQVGTLEALEHSSITGIFSKKALAITKMASCPLGDIFKKAIAMHTIMTLPRDILKHSSMKAI